MLSKFCQNLAKSPQSFAFNMAFFNIFQNLQDFANSAKHSAKIVQDFASFLKISKFSQNSEKFCKILQVCLREDDILVDLQKCCKIRIWTRKSASIQPRTSPGKSDCVVAPSRACMHGLGLGGPCACCRRGSRRRGKEAHGQRRGRPARAGVPRSSPKLRTSNQ